MKQISNDIAGARLNGYIWDGAPFSDSSRKRPCVIVCPGGGYTHLSPREGEPVALRFYTEGYSAFVLEYSVFRDETEWGCRPLWPKPLEQLSFAVAYVRKNAAELGIDASDITVIGFSAGGHLAACLGTNYNRYEFCTKLGIGEGMNRPDRLILGYSCLSGLLLKKDRRTRIAELLLGRQSVTDEELSGINAINFVSETTPPSFVFHTFGDESVPCEDSIAFARKLHSFSVPCELHVFSKGAHGFSLGNETTAASDEHILKSASMWFELCLEWLSQLRNE